MAKSDLVQYTSLARFISHVPEQQTSVKHEVFGFAPYWTLSKIKNVDWNVLSTFAYFSLPVNADGSVDRTSYEWEMFESNRLSGLLADAKSHNVRRVITLTQMEAFSLETFLSDPSAWTRVADESVDIIKSKDLDGVNIDFEYIPSDSYLKGQFSAFMDVYTQTLRKKLDNPYITVSILGSSVRFDKIYDISHLAKITDGIFMMAYDFYYPGSEKIGPSAPLYGFKNGTGPFWYDVSTATEDFLKVADSKKIILGVPYYGWNYPAYSPVPKTDRIMYQKAHATTNEKARDSLLSTTPMGGWDDDAKVSWRGYWDEDGWHVVYMEDEKSLALKYDFAKEKQLAGVGIWALGFEGDNQEFWSILREKFSNNQLAFGSILP